MLDFTFRPRKIRLEASSACHNEHEIEAARQLAAELGMGFCVKLSCDSGFSPVRDRAAIMRATGLDSVTHEEFRATHGYD
jgi:hypothetical protein